MRSLSSGGWRAPWVWRVALWFARFLVALVCRLRVTGVPPGPGPFLLAANHVGPIDPVVLAAAARIWGVAPRVMATGGVFRAPVLGWFMRAAGHIRVDRRGPTVSSALDAAGAALAEGSVVLVYPEGRIGLDPGLWPERGKTGTARLALAAGVPVVPVSQWGAHELARYGAPRRVWSHAWWVLRRRPLVRVHFGQPVDLSGLAAGVPGDAVQATERIMAAITAGLVPLRVLEPDWPRWVDPTRPVSEERSRRPPADDAVGPR